MSQIIDIPIDKIQYDLENPRIAPFFDDNPNIEPTPEYIARALREASSEDLRRSIRKTRGIKNAIKVYPIGNDEFRVFEGNTRLSIYKAFCSQNEAGDWSKIPSIVYEKIDENEIHMIRMQDHIVGTKEWGAYAKAKYLDQLYRDDFGVDHIANICGISESEIMRLVETFRFMNTEYRSILVEEDLDGPSVDAIFNERKFTAFEEYIKRDDVKKAVDYAGFTRKDFARWVACGLFTRNEDVRVLPEIMKKETARKVFFISGSREAKKLTDSPTLSSQLKEASLVQLCEALMFKTGDAKASEIKLIKESSQEINTVFDCAAELASFYDSYLKN